MKIKPVIWGFIFFLFGLCGTAFSQNPVNTSAVVELGRIEDAVTNVANMAGKAVVSISSEHLEHIGGGKYYFGLPFNQDESGRKFFEDFFGSIPERDFKQYGLGSGVIIDPEGYILTNEHVVSEADKITVTLSDGREFKAQVKGTDPRSDMAVIKINATNLPVAKLGNSDNIKIGQWVVAIGNPYGFAMQNPEPTVTVGVISALHRSLRRGFLRDRDYNDLIQTDAAINPGNSGGPLVNLSGEVIGVNVAIFSTSGGYQGLGFAVPIDSAKRILSRLIAGKKIIYGWMGITVQDLTEDLAGYFGLPDKNGVLVAKVLKNAPAEKAGIKEKDIIRQLDNHPVNNVRELLNIVEKAEIGKKIKVSLIRDKKMQDIMVTIGERPVSKEESDVLGAEPQEKEKPWRGLSVSDLNPELSERFDLEEKKGIVVSDVEPNSPADQSGIIPGDIVLEIDKIRIDDFTGYQKAIKRVKGNCLVRTQRGYFLLKESGR